MVYVFGHVAIIVSIMIVILRNGSRACVGRLLVAKEVSIGLPHDGKPSIHCPSWYKFGIDKSVHVYTSTIIFRWEANDKAWRVSAPVHMYMCGYFLLPHRSVIHEAVKHIAPQTAYWLTNQ